MVSPFVRGEECLVEAVAWDAFPLEEGAADFEAVCERPCGPLSPLFEGFVAGQRVVVVCEACGEEEAVAGPPGVLEGV
jgi:hypothetical protein